MNYKEIHTLDDFQKLKLPEIVFEETEDPQEVLAKQEIQSKHIKTIQNTKNKQNSNVIESVKKPAAKPKTNLNSDLDYDYKYNLPKK
jgi:hypothetical protein